PLLEAASSSNILKAKSSSSFSVPSLLIIFAKMRAQVVLPTPRGPVNNKACAKWLFSMALIKVFVIACCPTTSLKVCGLYFLADTTKCSIEIMLKDKVKNMVLKTEYAMHKLKRVINNFCIFAGSKLPYRGN